MCTKIWLYTRANLPRLYAISWWQSSAICNLLVVAACTVRNSHQRCVSLRWHDSAVCMLKNCKSRFQHVFFYQSQTACRFRAFVQRQKQLYICQVKPLAVRPQNLLSCSVWSRTVEPFLIVGARFSPLAQHVDVEFSLNTNGQDGIVFDGTNICSVRVYSFLLL